MRKSLFLVFSVGVMTLTAFPALAWAPEVTAVPAVNVVIQPRLIINPGQSHRVVRVVPEEKCGYDESRHERVVIVKKRGHRWHRHHSYDKVIIVQR